MLILARPEAVARELLLVSLLLMLSSCTPVGHIFFLQFSLRF